MTKTGMSRSAAMDMLAEAHAARLGDAQRESLILNWWAAHTPESPAFSALPVPLRALRQSSDEPADLDHPAYQQVLRAVLRQGYEGVLNTFLAALLAEIGRPASVSGRFKKLECCPCCGYHTLGRRGDYEICCVCFWEDDGEGEFGDAGETSAYSGPNQMTLAQGRANFRRLGAVEQRFLKYVVEHPHTMYPRQDAGGQAAALASMQP